MIVLSRLQDHFSPKRRKSQRGSEPAQDDPVFLHDRRAEDHWLGEFISDLSLPNC